MKNQIISGSCHCKAISYHLKTEISLRNLTVRACSCGFCTKTGNRYISDPHATLVIYWTESQAHHYQFSTKTADFIICKQCGVLPFVLCQIDSKFYAVVNSNTFNKQKQLKLEDIPKLNYDGEPTEDRLARRRKNWIGKVIFKNIRELEE
ncbi:MAG: hypothetical protein HOD92_01385 [Deltaproteobacteria bacterium]|jgi:hypothetical protein|nr:hypothetical protein [Deltaproteobacteria bacterium]MBT4525244.1 hypothetical protein [Deltaproteobacteria bacterium]